MRLIFLMFLGGCGAVEATPEDVGWAPDAAVDGSPADADTEADTGAEADAGAEADPVAPDPVAPAVVRYHLTWRRDRLEPAADGGFVVVNDLGHRIHLQRGYLSSYRAQLVPCPEETMGQLLLQVLGIGVAHAGHSGEEDPSATVLGRVESLTDLTDQIWEEVPYVVETKSYCKAHYLMARAEPSTPGLPDDRALVGKSLLLEGTVERPGEAPVAFVLNTALASGRIGTLRAPESEADFTLDPLTQGAAVYIERDPAAFLDGLDFFTMTQPELERALVYRLAEAVRIEAVAFTP